MKRERWKRLLHGTGVAGLAFAWLGLVFKGKDGTTAGAILYYATPWLLRLLSGLLAVVVLRHRGFRLMAATCVLLSLVEGWHSFHWSPPPPVAEGTLQISVWNAGRKAIPVEGRVATAPCERSRSFGGSRRLRQRRAGKLRPGDTGDHMVAYGYQCDAWRPRENPFARVIGSSRPFPLPPGQGPAAVPRRVDGDRG